MNAKGVIKLLKADGWGFEYANGSHRYYTHPTKSGKVTVPVHGAKDLKIKTLHSILKQAGLK